MAEQENVSRSKRIIVSCSAKWLQFEWIEYISSVSSIYDYAIYKGSPEVGRRYKKCGARLLRCYTRYVGIRFSSVESRSAVIGAGWSIVLDAPKDVELPPAN